jgi:hypothetical protein
MFQIKFADIHFVLRANLFYDEPFLKKNMKFDFSYM